MFRQERGAPVALKVFAELHMTMARISVTGEENTSDFYVIMNVRTVTEDDTEEMYDSW